MKIARIGNGLGVQISFDHAKDKAQEHSHWVQEQPIVLLKKYKEEKQKETCWSKLPFFTPLDCNPGIQIDFRQKASTKPDVKGFNIKASTEHIWKPKTRNIDFSATTNQGKMVFKLEGAEKDSFSKINIETQYLIFQVLDHEKEIESSDRVVAESLLTFHGYVDDPAQINYALISIYDVVGEHKAGWVYLESQYNNDNNTPTLHIQVREIINLRDYSGSLVKEDKASYQTDLLLVFIWLCYMIGTILFYIYAEDFTLIDAVYLRIVTAFTVGYGDLYPETDAGKLLNTLFIVVDTVTIGFITGKVMQYILKLKEIQKNKLENKERKKRQEIEKRNEENRRNQQHQQELLRKQIKKKKDDDDSDQSQSDIDEKDELDDFKDNLKSMANIAADVAADVGTGMAAGISNVAGKFKPATDELQKVTQITTSTTASFYSSYKLYILVSIMCLLIFIGTLTMIYVEDQDVASSFEWNFVTLSTVGYGNVTPSTVSGKIFTIFYIIFGVSLVIVLGAAIFEHIDENRQQRFRDRVMSRALIDTTQMLEYDTDTVDGKIDKYEFLSKMLVETQEIEAKKIKEIMTKFDLLDINGDNKITLDELQQIEGV